MKRADEAEAKLAGYERRAERAGVVSEVAAAKGVDAKWLGRMSGDARDGTEANADYILAKLAGTPIYPSVSDSGGKSAPAVDREQIEAIKDPRERVMALYAS